MLESVWQKLTRRTPLNGTLFGVELEIEGVTEEEVDSDSLFLEHSTVTTDGSLRNGVEIVTKPLNIEELRVFASNYEDWASDQDIHLSERTSTHIHVNVQDMTYEQLRSFLWLATTVEPVLMEYCSEQRQNNTYCYGVSSVTNTSSWLRGLLYHSQQNTLGPFLSSNTPPKYCAVGLFRFFDYGTVEFRMFDGTTSAASIVAWCTMIDSLRQLAMTQTVEQLRDRKQQEGVLSLLTTAIRESGNVTDERLTILLERGIEMANDITRKALSFQEILEQHKTLFPNKAPLALVRGEFGAELLAAYQSGGVDAVIAHSRKFVRDDFIREYGRDNCLFNLFREVCADVVIGAEIVTAVRTQYSL